MNQGIGMDINRRMPGAVASRPLGLDVVPGSLNELAYDNPYGAVRVVASPATQIRIGCQEVFIVVGGEYITLHAMGMITHLNQAEFDVVCSAVNQAAKDLSHNIAARAAVAP